jgi:predicted RNA-binding Zn-ribbon protein involved in translation (DUF1610 family)
MTEDTEPVVETICPVCGRTMMFLHTIRRAFADSLNVFQCKPCGFSTTEPESWRTPIRHSEREDDAADNQLRGLAEYRPGVHTKT